MNEDEKPILDDESTDFYDEFKDRMRQEPLSSVLSQKTAHSSKPLGGIMTVLIGVFLAALVLWYIIGKYFVAGNVNSELAPPIISADVKPVKVKPEDVGGMEIIGKDKSVYDRLSGDYKEEPEKIIAREKPEKPVAPPVSEPVVAQEKITVEVKESISSVIQEIEPEVSPTEPVAMAQVEVRPQPPVAVKEEKIVTETHIDIKKIEVQPVYEPSAPKSVPSVAVGPWKVQVMSSRDEKAVAKAWEGLKKKHPDLLGNVSHEIVSADLGARGIFYRLRVGGYDNRKTADVLCNELKKRKQDCIVVKQ